MSRSRQSTIVFGILALCLLQIARTLQTKSAVLDTLAYKHEAFRVELPMRSHAPALYKRIVGVMRWADSVVWKKLEKLEKGVVYPELEYIVYDARDGTHGTIEPHVDNHSAVTIVILLSDTKDFDGGINGFAATGSPN